MEFLVNHLHAWLLCMLITLIIVLTSCSLLGILRRRMKTDPLDGSRDSAGILFGAISLIYSLVLAFVIVAVWEDYEELNTTVMHESIKLQNVCRKAKELPGPMFSMIRDSVHTYAAIEVQREWHSFSGMSADNPVMLHVQQDLLKFDSLPEAGKKIVEDISSDIDDVIELRTERTGNVHSHVPFLVWVVLITGSIVVIVFSYFFFMPARLQYLFTSMLAGLITMCIFVLFMLDNPLCGTTAVSDRPFVELAK